MRIVSWNVNGLRAVLKNSEKCLKAFLDDFQADIICLQETKASKEQLDGSSCIADGYTSFFSFCKVKSGYSGVVTFCRLCATPVRAEEGLTGVLTATHDRGVGLTGDCHTHFASKEDMMTFDAEGRAVITEHICDWGVADVESVRVGGGGGGGRGEEGRHVVVINVYCPMVDRDNIKADRLDYKLLFYSVLQTRCTALEQAGKAVVVVGDLNCSREAIDSAYIQDTPSLLHGSPEREWMKQFVSSHPPPSHPPPSHPPPSHLPPSTISHLPPSTTSQPPSSPSTPSLLVDTFRHLHPTQANAYTCWSTLLGYRKTNYGTRIDYILCSAGLVPHLSQAEVCSDIAGSDHCPVMADFASLRLRPSLQEPSLSCALQLGRQTKLSAFMTPRSNTLDEGQSSRTEVKGREKVSNLTVTKGLKRKTAVNHSLAAKYRKTEKRTLRTFFQPPTLKVNDTPTSSQPGSDVITNQTSDAVPKCDRTTDPESSSEKELSSVDPPPPPSGGAPSAPQLTNEWQSLLSGPPKPPLCKGHNEPATLRTVRKAGPNRGRRFWVCSRPGGSKSDPATQCDFFQWHTRSKPKIT